ncbi:MAG: hypothetical protein R3229_03000 [Alphaproteobacteria bacterium]|nr:hypothetical protein [Alphaproteobacteria bacterium]
MGDVAILERLARTEMDSELAAILDSVGQATVRGAPKYAPRIQRRLARAIVCRAYAGAIYELVHLMAAGQSVFPERGYESLFWDQGPADMARFRRAFASALEGGTAKVDHICANASGVHVTYPDGAFTVSYSRMPFLAAMLDLLVAAIGFSAVDDAMRDALEAPPSRASVTRAANRITRDLYAYLKDRLPTAQAQRKFRALMDFLRQRHGTETVTPEKVDDEMVLDFWCAAASDQDAGGDWKTYRTVFRSCVHLRDALGVAADQAAVDSTMPLDPERDAGSISPGQVMAACAAADRRIQALETLRSAPADAIKFLTKREMARLSLIVACGDHAAALPLSILRAEVFGAAQARIIQALRRGAAAGDALGKSLDGGAETYASFLDGLVRAAEQGNAALHAAYHVLAKARHGDAISLMLALRPQIDLRPLAPALPAGERTGGTVVAIGAMALRDEFFAQAASLELECPELRAFVAAAADAHRNVSRKGFGERDARDPEIVDGFAVGADALLQIKALVDRYQARLARLMPHSRDRDRQQLADQSRFFTQFRMLYGGTP